jgi:callose synthase
MSFSFYSGFSFNRKKQANEHELIPVLAEVLRALLVGTGLEVVIFSTK